MTLRIRLNVLVTAIFLVMVTLGAALVIYNARRAVNEETRSTATLALQLIDLALETAGTGAGRAARLQAIADIETLEAARHLRVSVETPDDQPAVPAALDPAGIAVPRWFVDWVQPSVTTYRRVTGDSAIVISADPSDEIEESWDDAKTLLGLVLLFSFVANGLLFVLIGRWLRPLAAIGSAMDEVQRGNYRQRLPGFDLPELSSVASQFNRMTEVLEQSREENRRLTQKSLAIREDERRTLARELHDEFGQSISAIKAVAVSIDREDGQSATARAAAATIADFSNGMYSAVRDMMTRLRPALLEEFGLVRALQALVDAWNARSADAFCSLEIAGTFDDLDDDTSICLYRIVQEALTNVTKHAEASEVAVSLRQDAAARIVLEIRDNGSGFEPHQAHTGLGLRGIEERVLSLRGTVEVRSSAGGGTRLAIVVPRTDAEHPR